MEFLIFVHTYIFVHFLQRKCKYDTGISLSPFRIHPFIEPNHEHYENCWSKIFPALMHLYRAKLNADTVNNYRPSKLVRFISGRWLPWLCSFIKLTVSNSLTRREIQWACVCVRWKKEEYGAARGKRHISHQSCLGLLPWIY